MIVLPSVIMREKQYRCRLFRAQRFETDVGYEAKITISMLHNG